MKKAALICNSINPDLRQYFKVKYYSGRDNKHLVFFCNKNIRESDYKGVSVSSYSKSSSLSPMFLFDCFYSVYVFVKLVLSNVGVVIFDTAHIVNLPLSILLKIFRVRQIYTIHDWEAHPGKKSLFVSAYNWLVKSVLSDEFIVFSSVESSKPVHTQKLAGFPNAGSVKRGKYFLFFGRIEPYKGLDNLLKISEILISREPNCKIYIVGKGNDPSIYKLKKMQNVNVHNNFVDEEELNDLIDQSLAVLLPYKSATQSGVIVKAYSRFKPVVAFDVGSLGEYVNDYVTGRLIIAGDNITFVEAMLHIASNNDQYTKEVKDDFCKNYGEAAAGRQFKLLVKELLAFKVPQKK